VRIADHGADPMDYMTPDQQSMIRQSDTICVSEMSDNHRDPHLQLDQQPWIRTAGQSGDYLASRSANNWTEHERTEKCGGASGPSWKVA
jgi:hypothetical protein